jgi:sulfite exporter TauE/SafE
MGDITIVVAESLAALAMSLAITSRITIEVVRVLSYGAMIVFGARIFGVEIMAPIASRFAEMLDIIAFVWLIVATLAVCARGIRRSFSGKRSALNGS